MKRSELEKYLGKTVEIIMFDDEKIMGELNKTGEPQFKDNANLYYPHNYYFLINPQSFLFKCSHVKRVKI